MLSRNEILKRVRYEKRISYALSGIANPEHRGHIPYYVHNYFPGQYHLNSHQILGLLGDYIERNHDHDHFRDYINSRQELVDMDEPPRMTPNQVVRHMTQFYGSRPERLIHLASMYLRDHGNPEQFHNEVSRDVERRHGTGSTLLRYHIPRIMKMDPDHEETMYHVNNMMADYIDKNDLDKHYHHVARRWVNMAGKSGLSGYNKQAKYFTSHPMPIHAAMDHALENGMSPKQLTATMVHFADSIKPDHAHLFDHLENLARRK